jgi:hypothetical protein
MALMTRKGSTQTLDRGKLDALLDPFPARQWGMVARNLACAYPRFWRR